MMIPCCLPTERRRKSFLHDPFGKTESRNKKNIFEVHLLQSLRVALIYRKKNRQRNKFLRPCRLCLSSLQGAPLPQPTTVYWPRKIKVFGFITRRSIVVVELCVWALYGVSNFNKCSPVNSTEYQPTSLERMQLLYRWFWSEMLVIVSHSKLSNNRHPLKECNYRFHDFLPLKG